MFHVFSYQVCYYFTLNNSYTLQFVSHHSVRNVRPESVDLIKYIVINYVISFIGKGNIWLCAEILDWRRRSRRLPWISLSYHISMFLVCEICNGLIIRKCFNSLFELKVTYIWQTPFHIIIFTLALALSIQSSWEHLRLIFYTFLKASQI